MSEKDDEEKVITAWHTAFKKGTDFDLWGQPVEAIDGYQRLSATQVLAFKKSFTSRITDSSSTLSFCLLSSAYGLQYPIYLFSLWNNNLIRYE